MIFPILGVSYAIAVIVLCLLVALFYKLNEVGKIKNIYKLRIISLFWIKYFYKRWGILLKIWVYNESI